jgi:hypothetical protein
LVKSKRRPSDRASTAAAWIAPKGLSASASEHEGFAAILIV